MRRPVPGDVVPYRCDQFGPTNKIGLICITAVDDAADYLESDEDFVVFGSLLRRVYFEGRDPLVIDNDDVWTEAQYSIWGSELLPPMVPEYREDGGW